MVFRHCQRMALVPVNLDKYVLIHFTASKYMYNILILFQSIANVI